MRATVENASVVAQTSKTCEKYTHLDLALGGDRQLLVNVHRAAGQLPKVGRVAELFENDERLLLLVDDKGADAERRVRIGRQHVLVIHGQPLGQNEGLQEENLELFVRL